MNRIQQSLIAAQELGDEKLQIVTQLQELIDLKTRQLDHDFKNLDYGKDEPIIELQSKEQLPSTASSSPALASPVHTINILPVFNAGSASTLSTSTTATPLSVSSTTAPSDRFATTTNTHNSATSERSSKRPRRARNDTSVIQGNSTEPVSSSTSETTAISEIPQKQIITPTQSVTTAQSNATSQKKTNTNSAGGNSTGNSGRKTKKRKSGRGQTSTNTQQAAAAAAVAAAARDETPPPEEAIDPDEPTYCLCDQISFGEMILCDNDLCPIEWFHFSCVSLMSKPKGKWFCPNCRGDRPSVMKPKAQFLKELERYNKEKEEKT